MTNPLSERRDSPRVRRLVKLLLPIGGTDEVVFATDVSRSGLFLRSTVIPRLGSQITLLFPTPTSRELRVRLEGIVIRHVRRGDPVQPLGGMGIQLNRLISPRGVGPARNAVKTLLGDGAPTVQGSMHTAVVLELPQFVNAEVEASEIGIEEAPIELSRALAVNRPVFCRWDNMVVKATLARLGLRQAILTHLSMVPSPGDNLTVRLLSAPGSGRPGIQLSGHIDQVHRDPGKGAVVSLALAPLKEQSDPGGLRRFLRAMLAESQ